MTTNTAKRPRHRPIDEAKRTAILDAAREEFFAHGFAAASIEAIAEAASVSKVTVYNRFTSKEALFAAVVERECGQMSAGLEQLGAEDGELRQQLIGFGKRAIGFLSQPHVIRFERRIAAESQHMPQIGELFLNAGPRGMRRKLVHLLEQAVSNRAIRPCDCQIAAGHLYGMIAGFDMVMARFSEEMPEAEPLLANVEQAVDRFLAAYAP
jgi:TetR/AcrR family transcriptional regulator, mexJK operon transcriptional repressor